MAHTRAIVKGGFLDGDDFGPRLSRVLQCFFFRMGDIIS